MIEPGALVAAIGVLAIGWRLFALWQSDAKPAAVLVFLLTLYGFVPLWLVYRRQDVLRRVVPDLAGQELPLAEDAAAFVGLSILCGALLIRRRSCAPGDENLPTHDGSMQWVGVWVNAPLALAVVYLGFSNAQRWQGASYLRNDVIKSNPIDAALFTFLAVILGTLLGIRFFRESRWRATWFSTAMLLFGTLLLLWTAARIGARAQILYFVAGLAPFVGSWAFERRPRRNTTRFAGLLVAILLLLVSVAALRVIRSPYYENQGILAAASQELGSADALIDQDYGYPGIPLILMMAESADAEIDIISAEFGATLPFLPGENLSIQFARSIGAERVARSEGFGATPLLTGFLLFGWFGFIANGVLIWAVAGLLSAFTRSTRSRTAYLAALGSSYAAALYVTRSEFGGVVFFLLVFGIPTLMIARSLIAGSSGKRTRTRAASAIAPLRGVDAEAVSKGGRGRPISA